MGTIMLSALVAHTAWHWMTERGATLREYRIQWPVFDLALAATVVRWLMLLLIIGIAARLSYLLARWAMPGRDAAVSAEPRT